MEFVIPAGNFEIVVVVVYSYVIPEVSSWIGSSPHCCHQSKIIAPAQLIWAEHSTDGRVGLAGCIHRGITVGSKSVYGTRVHFAFMPYG